MDVRVQVTDDGSTEAAALGQWLSDEHELRGRVRGIPAPLGPTELGGATDLLVVAVGAGGAGTVLARSLITWIQNRRTTAKITVEVQGKRITLDIDTVEDITPLLQHLATPAIDEP
ncbi:hypothetical protein ACH4TV_39520 [Streptomyces sp. NPDC020898]|uniref:effector-associated constant component EACC1 n=1 Tax=Streptomyces sp. NPDC020898 TaxID=3365101 RepID=UPI0037BDC5CE